jgi:hypothetical protein
MPHRWVALAVILLGGCTFIPSTVNVGYPEAAARPGPLASVESRRVEIGHFEDQRFVNLRGTMVIGWQTSKRGRQMAPIATSRPIPEIVREALAVELKRNGHMVVGGGSDVVLSGEILEFGFSPSVGRGSVEIALTALDGNSGSQLFKQTYYGTHEETTYAWQRVMNMALAALVHEIATDPRLVQALAGSSRLAP